MADWRVKGLGYLPLCMFTIFVITVGISYLIAVLRGDVAVVFPYISDTGGKPPESCVFAQFVNLSSLILLAMMYIRYKELDSIEGLPPRQVGCVNKASFILGLLATLGLSFVGNFQNTNVLVVHEIGAVALFLFGTIYSIIHTRISYLLYPEHSKLFICRVRLVLTILMAVSLVTCFSCEGVASAQWKNHHNATDTQFLWKPTDGGYTFHILSTSFEWALAGSFALFCLTFVSEFSKVSLVLYMFLFVEPFANNAEPDERTPLYT